MVNRHRLSYLEIILRFRALDCYVQHFPWIVLSFFLYSVFRYYTISVRYFYNSFTKFKHFKFDNEMKSMLQDRRALTLTLVQSRNIPATTENTSAKMDGR